MVRYRLRDISVFFKSNCCIRVKTENRDGLSCKSHPRPPAHKTKVYKIHEYFERLLEHEPLYATTITIGNKTIGKMSYHDQYKYFVKLIREKRPYNGAIKYIYHFELTQNGQLHAHGVETGGYSANFHEAFGLLGKHNLSPKAYLEVVKVNFSKYLEYINKENIKPIISNVTNKDVHVMVHT